jgi:hypothetical protein
MALAPGTKLGPYEIVAPIGAGGMGGWEQVATRSLDRSPRIASKDPPSVSPVGCWLRACTIRAVKPPCRKVARVGFG